MELNDPTFKDYIPELVGWLAAIGHTPQGAEQHGRQALRFLSWLEKKGIHSIESIDPPTLVHYRQYLKSQPSQNDGGKLHGKTIYAHLRTVQLLFDLLLETGRTTQDPMSEVDLEYPKVRSHRQVLSQMEIAQLYQACNQLRERAILALAYGCGLRAAELEALNIQDIRFKDRLLIVQRGKNSKRRVIPLSEGVRRDLELYYRSQRRYLPSTQQAFLLHDRRERMRGYTANKRLRQLASRSGLRAKPISIHVLRHSIATHLLENGVGVDQVRTFLGHALLSTTEVYTHINNRQLHKMVS